MNYFEVLKKREEINNANLSNKTKSDRISSYSFEALLKVFSNYLMFCNCWFIKPEESHAMWAEYGDKIPTSIAIQTTVGNLKKSFEKSKFHIHIGKVRYINYEEDHIKGYEKFTSQKLTDPDIVLKLFYAPVMHKRNIYTDEHEVRAIISFENIYKKYLEEDYKANIPFCREHLFDLDTYNESRDDHESDQTKRIRKGEEVKCHRFFRPQFSDS